MNQGVVALSAGSLLAGLAMGAFLPSSMGECTCPCEDGIRALEERAEEKHEMLALQAEADPTDLHWPPQMTPVQSERRDPVAAAHPTDPALEVADLGAQIAELARLAASARSTLQASLPVTRPPLDSIRRAAESPHWEALLPILDASLAGRREHDAMVEQLRWTSQEELLILYGRPTRIDDDGAWVYHGTSGAFNGMVRFSFVGDYVMQVVGVR